MAILLFVTLQPLPSACAGEPDSGGPRVSPFWSCARSGIVPGWGQVHNGNGIKGMLIFSMQSYLFARFSIAERRADFYQNELDDPQSAWGSVHLRKKYDDFRGTRNDMVWWMSIFGLYSLIDAYVDAHMAGFDEDVAGVQRITWGPVAGGTGGEVALAVKVPW